MKKYPTIFCDIDGTIFRYREFFELELVEAEVIESVQSYLQKQYLLGTYIVITTARPELLRIFTEIELKRNNIPYHQLVMGIGRAERIIINDHEEGTPERAISMPVVRDKGI